MKFIADENVPLKAIEKLREDMDIKSVIEIKKGMRDLEIVKISSEEKAVIITFDKDFGRLATVSKVKPFGVILLRIQPKSIEYIIST
jgi:predicted nuclease of predicted toxin-antitoxin system